MHFFRVFGCIGYVHVPQQQRKKLDDRSIKCVHLGVSEESKAYKMYDPVTKKVWISRDVKFVENEQWEWKVHTSNIQVPLLDEEEMELAESSSQNDTSAVEESQAVRNGEEDASEDDKSPPNEGRIRKKPVYLDDHITGIAEIDEEIAGTGMTETTSIEAELHLVSDTLAEDPVTFDEVVKNKVWRQDMDSEMEFIERNGTWELIDLPQNVKKIGVK